MKTIGLFGANGFVGNSLLQKLERMDYRVSAITRLNFEQSLKEPFDYLINAAMPAARFKAKNNPLWDFEETVEKTAKMFYSGKFTKFIQISSVSARCQLDTVYGRHKKAAEVLLLGQNHLTVRLGPMFGPTLSKGVLMDMLKNNPVFVGRDSRYAFAPLDFVTEWISKNLDRVGTVEVGAKNSIRLSELADVLKLQVRFDGVDDHQEIENPELSFPDVQLVIDYMNEQMRNFL